MNATGYSTSPWTNGNGFLVLKVQCIREEPGQEPGVELPARAPSCHRSRAEEEKEHQSETGSIATHDRR